MALNRPLRIALLSDFLPPDSEGGLELSAAEIGAGLEELGHEVQFVCAHWRNSYNGPRESSSQVHRILRSVDVRQRPGSKLPRQIESLRAVERKINIARTNYRILRSFLKAKGPFDVALVFGVLSIGLGTVRAFSDEGIPVVWSIGDVALPAHFAMPGQTRLYDVAFKTVGRKWHAVEKRVDFSRMIFVSEFVRRELLKGGFDPSSWAIVPRAVGFEPQEWDVESKAKPPLIFVASRLAPSRGVHIVLEALCLLAERRPELGWALEVAGGGDPLYVEELRRLAEPLGTRVSFLGKLSKEAVLDRMRRASIVVNPTVEVEGFGRANIEALACGVALVASDVPALHEIVGDSECAMIYPPEDVCALSNAIERLLDKPSLAKDMANKGVGRIRERFLFGQVLSEIELFIRRAEQDA